MAQMIDGIPYPSNWRELKKDKKLMKLFVLYSKKIGQIENVLYLERKKNVNKDFITFIQPNAVFEINISSGLKKQFLNIIRNAPKSWEPKTDRMVPMVNWDDPAWGDLFDDAEKEVLNMMNHHHLISGAGTFWHSKEFKAYHTMLLNKREPVVKAEPEPPLPDWKKLQLMGFADAKKQRVRASVGKMIAALQGRDAREAKKALRDAQAWEPDGSMARTATFEEMVKRLKKYKLLA